MISSPLWLSPKLPTPIIALSVRSFVQNKICRIIDTCMHQDHRYVHLHSCIIHSCIRVKDSRSKIYSSYIPASYTHVSGSRIIDTCITHMVHACTRIKDQDHGYVYHTIAIHANASCVHAYTYTHHAYLQHEYMNTFIMHTWNIHTCIMDMPILDTSIMHMCIMDKCKRWRLERRLWSLLRGSHGLSARRLEGRSQAARRASS